MLWLGTKWLCSVTVEHSDKLNLDSSTPHCFEHAHDHSVKSFTHTHREEVVGEDDKQLHYSDNPTSIFLFPLTQRNGVICLSLPPSLPSSLPTLLTALYSHHPLPPSLFSPHPPSAFPSNLCSPSYPPSLTPCTYYTLTDSPLRKVQLTKMKLVSTKYL